MDYLKFGIKLALGFFCLGTALLVVFYFTFSPELIMLGYQFTATAVLINWLYIGILLFRQMTGKISAINVIKTIGVLFLNIPVALLYVYVVMTMMSYARITFENATGADINTILIEECEQHTIDGLAKDEATTVWIKIPGDCQVNIEYEVNGKKQRETVASYLTALGGLKATYAIGSNKDILEDL